MLQEFIIRILWSIGIVHVPEWDNTPSFYKKKEAAQEKPVLQPKKEVQTITRAYGRAEPGQKQKVLQLAVTASEDVPEWNYQRYDGQDGTFDFSEWSNFDDAAVEKLQELRPQVGSVNYMLVRPDVIQGLSNREIAAKHNKKIRWAEEYAGAVRQAFRERSKAEALADLSPTAPIDRGTAEGPQIPQGRGLTAVDQ